MNGFEHDERWNERLSEHLDGTLDAATLREVDSHLAGCASCRAVRAELERVRDAARVMDPIAPSRDLWPAIEARLAARTAQAPLAAARPASDAEPQRVLRLPGARWWERRFSLGLPQALAAAVLLVAVAGGLSWLSMRQQPSRVVASREPGPQSLAPGAPAPSVSPGLSSDPGADAVFASVDPRYDATIAELQRVLVHERANLDTSTVRIVEQNLGLIDRALGEAQRALENDPSNAYLRFHLAATMKRKVELLRRATVIAGAQG
ncbi:MAG: hypothetical protein HOP12_05385 [Candidatus Eisenbacteria bacterium]|uniref:Putative zinc-finger domain-containing protein n=1 Tax=Eiseniibacteriota bacterium TaxID=2212470 RepID=A0A849SWR9_UNCEI|nr:hypothetical protein [Candidatus Eisenbacteria bacterium]